MASFKPRPGCIQVIRGDVVEAIEMKFCIPCSLWYVEGDHNHVEPVEPVMKEIKIAGLLTY